MTVKELKEILNDWDESLQVCICTNEDDSRRDDLSVVFATDSIICSDGKIEDDYILISDKKEYR